MRSAWTASDAAEDRNQHSEHGPEGRGRMRDWLDYQMTRQLLLLLVIVALAPGCFAATFNCQWSNVGCKTDDDCCSKRCVRTHEGTNYRCTKSGLHEDCLFTYQCESHQKCSALTHKCCSPYWGTCRQNKDCCDPQNKCIDVRGFYYKRCLQGPVPESGQAAVRYPGNGVDVVARALSISSFILVVMYILH